MILADDHFEAAEEEAATLSKLGMLLNFFFWHFFRLAHKNIVRYVDFFNELVAWHPCQWWFIAMQRCAGGSLVDWIDRMKKGSRRTSGAEAAVIGAQLVSALSYCHGRGIGHYDLKPKNVYIMADFIEVNQI